MRKFVLCSVLITLVISATAINAQVFDGQGDNQRDDLGYYYAITGGKFPTGNTPNGDNGSTPLGGTFRYILDDPSWGVKYTLDTWRKDDWFPQNAGIALTLKSGGNVIYDNNGIEDNTYGDYYNATAQGVASGSCPGLYRGFSMSNNLDWIYAGYFKLTKETTIDQIIGYFDANSGFDPANAQIGYRMNIWSNIAGTLMPTNTGSFTGDVFSTDNRAATLAWSDTGVDRVFGADYDSTTDDILRLTCTLNAPITLQAGEYWFSHDATINPAVPEPMSIMLGIMGLGSIAGFRKIRRS